MLKPFCKHCEKIVEVTKPSNTSDARRWCKECGEAVTRYVESVLK